MKTIFRAVLVAAFLASGEAGAWIPMATTNDPLIRMPGTQPGQKQYDFAMDCIGCHAGYDNTVEPGFNWKGSMMAMAMKDPVFWACMTVAEQDSIWAVGRPNAGDICLRCHSPKGWLEGRSDPVNGSAMTGNDFDGVLCHFCHEMVDPFFQETYTGAREGTNWLGYWDETNLSGTPSSNAALSTYNADIVVSQVLAYFNGLSLYGTNHLILSTNYTENASGQYFVATPSTAAKLRRASFADANPNSHNIQYSRYHKSKYFCATCHDVSNPILANIGSITNTPGTGTNRLPTEVASANSYFHVERTFSEFMLSAYAQPGGAPGSGFYNPATFKTSLTNNYIGRCQDCHMPDGVGKACQQNGGVVRPTNSTEHPTSGQPVHDFAGGNAWIPSILASTVSGSPNYDAVNAALLNNKAATLTMDLGAGTALDSAALLAGAGRSLTNLMRAASITNVALDGATGLCSFRIVNHTAHKLISGFPEGRRMIVNVKAFNGTNLVHEVNPYDTTVSTLRGLDHEYSPNSPALGTNETYNDELVYETHPRSDLTGEEETFHFALATGRYKDNRIPPKGFQIGIASNRICEPVWHGDVVTNYFTPAEYAGGYDDVSVTVSNGATSVEVRLYYQTTSREYMEFLRDEIKGTNTTLTATNAYGDTTYRIQTDAFFSGMKAWGDTIWSLWTNNRARPGAAPVLMAQGSATSSAPVLVLSGVPGNITYECSDISSPPTVTATGSCETNIPVVLTVTTNAGACPSYYTLTRVWTATDSCSNSVAATQIVSVVDTTAPVLTNVPANVTNECSAIEAPPVVGAVDNCDTGLLTPVLTVTTNAGICPNGYELVRVWSVSDACSNGIAVTQIVAVVDTVPPLIGSVPTSTTVVVSDIPPPAEVSAADLCGTTSVVFAETTNLTADGFVLTRSWTAFDACGNAAAATQLITVINGNDSDGDGIPGDWEWQHFGSPTGAVAEADSDGDGASNWEEYFADTIPTNGTSVLRLLSITPGAGNVIFDWQGGVQAYQYLEFYDPALSGGVWSALFSNPVPTPVLMTFTNTAPLPTDAPWFRIRATR